MCEKVTVTCAEALCSPPTPRWLYIGSDHLWSHSCLFRITRQLIEKPGSLTFHGSFSAFSIHLCFSTLSMGRQWSGTIAESRRRAWSIVSQCQCQFYLSTLTNQPIRQSYKTWAAIITGLTKIQIELTENGQVWFGLNVNFQMCFKSRKVVKYELQGIQKNQELSPTQPTNSKSRVWLAASQYHDDCTFKSDCHGKCKTLVHPVDMLPPLIWCLNGFNIRISNSIGQKMKQTKL